MSPLVVLFLFYYLTYISSANLTFTNNRHLLEVIGPVTSEDDKELDKAKPEEQPPVVINIATNQTKQTPPKIAIPKGQNTTQIKNETKFEEHKVFKPTEMESGALLRGVSVVVILTTIVILYMALRTYCSKKLKNPVMVSKYGVRTRRSDIEMTPLPLDEDEEDETVFEVHNTNR